MFNNIRDRILRTRKAYGLEISLLAGEGTLFQLVYLKLEKNQITREMEIASIRTMEELKKHIPANTPLAVVVNGKGVLHKKIPLAAMSDNLFESILPNGNPADFYLQTCRYDSFASVYVARKAVLDNLAEELIRHRFKVLSISLGNTDLQYVMPFINFDRDTEEIKTNHFLLQMKPQGVICDVESIPFLEEPGRQTIEYSIGNYYVYPTGIMAFSAAMGMLAGSILSPPDIAIPQLLTEREDYKYYKYFKAASWAFLSGLFGILLINFFIYNYYYSRNEQQQLSAALIKAEEDQAGKLQSVVTLKEHFISEAGWGKPSRISFYADRIAALLPDDAQLTGLKINPLHTGLIGDNGQSFQNDTIQLTGNCENPAELNRFANNLRNIQGFREIDIKSYSYKKEAQTGIFVMEITTF